MNDEQRGTSCSSVQGSRAARVPRTARAGGLAIVIAAYAIGVSACGGPDSGSAAAPVASLGTNRATSGRSTVTTAPKNNAGQSLVEWALCMRRHGDPDQSDPTIDAHGVINVYIPGSAASLSDAVHNGTAPCNAYLAGAANALRAAMPAGKPPDQSQLVRFSQCMRENGVPNYPDPGTEGETNFQGTGIDPNSPFVERATNVCGRKINAPGWWISGVGPPGDISVQSGLQRVPGAGARRGGLVNQPQGAPPAPTRGG